MSEEKSIMNDLSQPKWLGFEKRSVFRGDDDVMLARKFPRRGDMIDALVKKVIQSGNEVVGIRPMIILRDYNLLPKMVLIRIPQPW